MNTSIDLQYKTISLEAFSGENALKSAIARLPHFYDNLKGFFNEKLGQPVASLFTKKDLMWFANHAKKLEYAKIRALPVPVPPGLTCDFLHYSKVLETSCRHTAKVKEEVLQPFSKWLSMALASPGNLAAHAPAKFLKAVKVRNLTAEVNKVNACFDAKSLTASQPLGNVIRRSNDWPALAAEAVQIQTMFGKEDHRQLVDEVNKCTDLLGQLLTRIQEDPSVYKTSPTTVGLMADVAYAVAKEVEFYGILRYKAVEHQVALEGIVEKIKPLLADTNYQTRNLH